MAISFGGLATGMDTTGLIEALMTAERAPVNRLESDKIWLTNRLTAYTAFDEKLNTFLNNIQSLGDRDQYFSQEVTTTSGDYFTATASTDALEDFSYLIEVESLAQVQKSYSNVVDGGDNDIGFSSKDGLILGTGAFVINVDGVDKTINLTSENNSPQGLMDAINDAEIGVRASIINDGTDSPYRMTFTGQTSASSFTINAAGLTGGTESFHNFEISQPGTQAHIVIDGLDVYSDSNTVKEAIPGVTLDLLKAESGTETQISINRDTAAVAKNIKDFVAGYNEVISFVTTMSSFGDSEGGILSADSGISTIKRYLQNTLTTLSNNTGSFRALSQLGLETQKNGTIVLNSDTLNEAIETDIDSIVTLLSGEDVGSDGIAANFNDYLEGLTNGSSGILAGREQSINSNISRIDNRIEQAERRLAKREETLKAQFNAMEQMVSLMNAESDFLTQQMSNINNIWNYNK